MTSRHIANLLSDDKALPSDVCPSDVSEDVDCPFDVNDGWFIEVQEKQVSPPCKGLGWRSCGFPFVHQWILSSRRASTSPNGICCTTLSSSPQPGFGMQQLKDSDSVGDLFSSRTQRTDMIKNISFQGPIKVCFAVVVNARTPPSCRHQFPNSSLAIRLNPRTP